MLKSMNKPMILRDMYYNKVVYGKKIHLVYNISTNLFGYLIRNL